MQKRMVQRLVFFPLPLQGHINPLFQLADIFYSKGFSISIICTHFNSPNPANYPHFAFHVIDDGLSEEDRSMEDLIAFAIKVNETCVPFLRKCLSDLLSDASDHEPVACLITDAVCYTSQAVADSLNLHRFALRTSSITSFVSAITYPLIREKGYLSRKDTEAVVSELAPLRIKDIPKVKTRDPKLYEDLYSYMVKATKSSNGLIFNSFQELEATSLAILHQDLSVPIYAIGPFHKRSPSSSSSLLTEERSAITWLDEQPPNSVIYISFGSLANFSEKEFIEMAWGLANSGQSFLWVVRTDLIHGSKDPNHGQDHFPDGFTEAVAGRSHVVRWAPQQDVLAHVAVGGFFTHCGWNSTLESICEGVPMICLPCFSDQTINARYVSEVWRVGIHLEGKVERGAIETGVRRLMAEEDGEEMRKRIMCLKKSANKCLSRGGSSSDSLETLLVESVHFDGP